MRLIVLVTVGLAYVNIPHLHVAVSVVHIEHHGLESVREGIVLGSCRPNSFAKCPRVSVVVSLL